MPHLRARAAAIAALACAGACASAAAGNGGSAPWPEMPDPPRAQVEWVARDVRINGLPSRIERFESELSLTELLDFYRGKWAHATAGPPRETQASGWSALSTLQGPFQLAVQARPRLPQGTEGMLSVANFGDMNPRFVPGDWPRWRDLKVMQVTESIDGPKRSQLIAMVSTESFDLNLRRWREEWLRRGFTLTREQSMPGATGARTWLATFDKAQQSLDITLTYRPVERRTVISTNLVGPVAGNVR